MAITLVMRPKIPRRAALLSLVIPGAGEIYNGHFFQGSALLFLSAVVGATTVGIGWLIIGLGCSVHSYKQARLVNRRYLSGLDEIGRSFV